MKKGITLEVCEECNGTGKVLLNNSSCEMCECLKDCKSCNGKGVIKKMKFIKVETATIKIKKYI